MRAMGLSDPAKLLAMLDATDGEGIELGRLPCYIYMMKEGGLADFRYRCESVSGSNEVRCHGLFEDIADLLGASLVLRSSPVQIMPDGKELLGELDSSVVESAEAQFSKFLDDVKDVSDAELRARCRELDSEGP